jgi:uncharacterized protein YigA (DUF484 family)
LDLQVHKVQQAQQARALLVQQAQLVQQVLQAVLQAQLVLREQQDRQDQLVRVEPQVRLALLVQPVQLQLLLVQLDLQVRKVFQFVFADQRQLLPSFQLLATQ